MKYRMCWIVFLIASVAWSYSTFAQTTTPASTNPAFEEMARLAPLLDVVDASILVKWFNDNDPAVRAEAYRRVLYSKIHSATVLWAICDASEKDTNPMARKMAQLVVDNIQPITNDPRREGVTYEVETELIARTQSKSITERTRALRFLGIILACEPDALAAYKDALHDADPALQLTAVNAVGNICDGRSQVETRNAAVTLLLEPILGKDRDLRDAASKYAYSQWNSFFADPQRENALRSEFTRWLRSGDTDQEGIAAIILDRLDNFRQVRGVTTTAVTKQDIAQAIRHRLAWVRTAACDRLFRSIGHVGWDFDGTEYGMLLEVVSDPDADVAREAALRLAGYMPLNDPGNARKALPNDPFGAVAPAIALAAALCRDADPTKRLQGVQQLAQGGNNAVSAVPLLTVLFSDPDKQVQSQSRAAATTILSEVIKKWPRATTMQMR